MGTDAVTHMMKEKNSDVTTTRCGEKLPTKKLRVGEVTGFESRVTCSSCTRQDRQGNAG